MKGLSRFATRCSASISSAIVGRGDHGSPQIHILSKSEESTLITM